MAQFTNQATVAGRRTVPAATFSQSAAPACGRSPPRHDGSHRHRKNLKTSPQNKTALTEVRAEALSAFI